VQKNDIAYKNLYDILSKEEAEVCIAGNREVFESKRQVRTEEWVKNGRGELRLLSVSKTPKLDKDGNVEYVVCASEDITERKQAEEALQDSEEKWRSLTENSIDYIMTLDCDGTLLFVNRTPSGVTREEVIGTSIFDHFPEKFKLVLKESINRVVETGEPDKHYVEYTSPDGITRHFEGRAAPIIRSGRVAAITINATDITEHQQLAEELKEHRDHLQELVEERTAELTITNEQLQQEIIERKRAERRLLTYHKRLRSLASALSLAEERERRRIATEVHDLVGQNLALAKLKLATLLETSSSSARGAADEVNRLIDEVIQDTRFLVSELGSPVLYELGFVPAVEWLTQQTQQRHGIAIEFEADVQPKPLSEDVRILLFQAARELLANIVRHARADTAKVSITRTGDQIQVDVSDDGVGFDPAEIGPGMDETGRFGLFSIRERLEPLGGHMEVKSKPGHGTHVTLVGPLGSE
jgi:PAS domain S-box-containing protein